MPNYRLKLYDDSLPISVEEWRAAARRKLPELAWAYLEGGADDLVARDANMASFRQWRLRQRVLTGTSAPDLSATVAKTPLQLPLALAPTGATGLSHWQGDIAAGRAAEKAGVRMVLSTA